MPPPNRIEEQGTGIPDQSNTHIMTTTVHILWGRDAVGRYRMGIIDNVVRIAHAVYDFRLEEEAKAFLFGVGESREPGDWLQVTSSVDSKKLGTPVRIRLIEAAKNGDVDAIRALLDTGVNFEAKDEKGLNALHWAATNGHVEVAEALVDAGADIDARAQNGTNQTPLHMAAASKAFGTAAVVDLLVQRGANVESADHLGNRPLHSVVGGQDADLKSATVKMKSLLDDGRADPRSENNRGEKPLFSPVGAAACNAAVLTMMSQKLNASELAMKNQEELRAERLKSMSGMNPWQKPQPH